MKKFWIIVVLILIIATLFFVYLKNSEQPQNNQSKKNTISENVSQDNTSSKNAGQKGNQSVSQPELSPPLDQPKKRITKKPFGIFITPQDSPVQPERFLGYHTGVDFEVFPEEKETAVPVKAACAGKLISKKFVSGYGGTAVQQCRLENQPITVIYGHLDLESIEFRAGDNLSPADILGILGADKSAETDGERKHLHLAFHKGKEINYAGYVQNESQLSSWIDPCLYICGNQ